MDPLSITVSIITLIGAGGKVGKALRKIASLRWAPAILLSLNNEVVNLQVVVQDVSNIVQRHSEIIQEGGVLSVYRALEQSRETLLALERLIAYELTVIESNGEPRLDRSAWIRVEPKVQKIKDDIRNDRAALALALSILTSSVSLDLCGQMRTVESLVRVTSEHQSFEPVFGFIEETAPPESSEQNQIISRSSQQEVKAQPYAMTSQSQIPQPGRDLESHATSPKTTQILPILGCNCTCYRNGRLRSPTYVDTLLGSFCLGYKALPWLVKRCENTCCEIHSTSVTYTYTFPRWFLRRVMIARIEYQQSRGPEFCLRLVRVRPSDANIFVAIFSTGSNLYIVHQIERMLRCGQASVLDVDPQGRTVLQIAVSNGMIDVVDLLVRAGSDIFYEDCVGLSAYTVVWRLILGSRDSSRSSYIERLHEYVQDQSQLTCFGFPELLRAYLGISGKTFRSIIVGTSRSEIDSVDSGGRTTLSWAAQRGDHSAVKQLLSYGADPNHADACGLAPLYWSVIAKTVTCTQILLAAKANVNAKDIYGSTALCCAVMKSGKADFIEVLLSYEADIESRDETGRRPIHWATTYDQADALLHLLRRGADINAVTSNGVTALLMAISYRNHDTLSVLIHDEDLEYNGTLKFAAMYADLVTIQILRSASLDKMAVAEDEGLWESIELENARWRRDHNVEWADLVFREPDNDPFEWYEAFEGLVEDVFSAQQRIIEEGTCQSITTSEENSADEDEHQEVWEDAQESVFE